MARRTSDRNRPRLDAAALERLALDYVAKYATTRAKVRTYLERKIGERGWGGDGEPGVETIVARLAASGFIDDRAFAVSRSASLGRRGYGAHRVGTALRAAGIAEDDAAPALEEAADSAWDAAEAFARRRKIGPFSAENSDIDQRRKAFAAMLRAGHPMPLARAFTRAAPGEMPSRDD